MSMAVAARAGSLRVRRNVETWKRGRGGDAVGEEGEEVDDVFIARVADEEDDGGGAEALDEKRNALGAAEALEQHGIGDVVGDGRVWERRWEGRGNRRLN